jgi:peptidoglycan-associated lipoprotein
MKGRTIARNGSLLLLVGLVGCGYAKRKDVDAQFAQMRTEVQQGDQQLDGKITTVDGRVTQLDGRVNGLEGRTAALERDLQALRTEFGTKIEQMNGKIGFAVPVNFDFDKADVREQDKAVLERFASIVKSYHPDAVITIEGFADPSGGTAYNQRLGLKRAEAVKEYLVGMGGLTPDKVRAVSYGETRTRLVNDGRGPDAGAENRRVSLVIDFATPGAGTRVITDSGN